MLISRRRRMVYILAIRPPVTARGGICIATCYGDLNEVERDNDQQIGIYLWKENH